jgi:hypothetical protein
MLLFSHASAKTRGVSGADPMGHYRIYFLDERGRIARAEDIDSVDDAAALAKARERHHPHHIEVWQSNRLAAIVEPWRG